MPVLNAFVTCEKVIISEEGQLSLITIFDQLNVTVAPDSEVARSAMIPAPWNFVTLWHREPTDGDQIFIQRMRLVSPTGTQLAEDDLEFSITGAMHRNIMRAKAFPIGEAGPHNLILSLRAKDGEWQTIATYTITVVHSVPTIDDAEVAPKSED